MCLTIFSALESPRAFSSRIAFAVEGGIFFNSGFTYRFFGFDLALEAVFALDGESMTSLFLKWGKHIWKKRIAYDASETQAALSCFKNRTTANPVNHPVIPYVLYRI